MVHRRLSIVQIVPRWQAPHARLRSSVKQPTLTTIISTLFHRGGIDRASNVTFP